MQLVFSTAQGLVITDGTQAGTSIIKASVSGAGGFDPLGRMVAIGSEVLFVADAGGGAGSSGGENNLWITDGTAARTSLVVTLPDDTPYGGTVVDSETNTYDLTQAGTNVVFGYNPGGPYDGAYSNVTYATDGTAAGTDILLNEPLGISVPSDDYAHLANGDLVYPNLEGMTVTDGTAAGTVTLKSGLFGNGYFNFQAASLGSIVVCSLPGSELWATDGTVAGTSLITTLPGLSNAAIGNMQSVGSLAIFSYEYAGTSFVPDLWVTDGTSAGTQEIPTITNPQFGAATAGFALVIASQGLVATDGTVAGTKVIVAGALDANGTRPYDLMTTLGNDIVFAAGTTAGPNGVTYANADQLWITDGTAAGTHLIAQLPDAGGTDFIGSITTVGDHVLFTYPDASGNQAVWTSDGTAAGTFILMDDTTTYFATGADALLMPCFLEGVRIMTDTGPRPVESLAVGDRVRMISGALAPFTWVGHRRLKGRTHTRPEAVWPVRIAAGAFADNTPSQDLFLSPDHAVHADGVLIPVKHLINGRTIRQEPRTAITYWHIALPSHDVVLAEDMPVESFLDTGNRRQFANGGDVVSLYPDFERKTWDTDGYAPMVVTGPILVQVRAHLLNRADDIHTMACSRTG